MNTEKSVGFLTFCIKLTISLFFLSLSACNNDDNSSIETVSVQKQASGHQRIIPRNKIKTFNYAGTAYSKTFSFGLNTTPHKNMLLNNKYMFAMTRFGPNISDKQINLFYGSSSVDSFFARANKPFSDNIFDLKGSTVAPISINGLVINIFDKPGTIGLNIITPANDRLIHFRQNDAVHQTKFNLDNHDFLSFFKAAANFKLPGNDAVKNNLVDKIAAISGAIPVTNNTDNIVEDVVLDVKVSSVDIKTVRFDWSTVKGAVQYKIFVNPDAISGFNLLQDMQTETRTTVKLPLHLTDWINASYVIQAYDNSGIIATSPVIDIASIMQSSIGYFKAGKVAANDSFGYVVSLSADGGTMVVGAKGDGDKLTGAVYVFSNKGNKWIQQAIVKASNIEQLARFGFSMGLSADGNTLAVGALLKNANVKASVTDNNTDPGILSAGVYIFSRNNISWSQQAYLNVESTASELFDLAVSLSADGSTLAVGTLPENAKSGSVHVFYRSADAWVQQAKIRDVNVNAGHLFAHAVSLSANGNTLAVGAPAEMGNDISTAGKQSDNSVSHVAAVYIFIRDDKRWVRHASVRPDNNGVDATFGATVALSADGNTLAVGNVLKNTVASVHAVKPFAAVHVFKRSDRHWIQQAHIDASQVQGSNGFDVGKLFGGAISLSADGKTLAVGTIDEGSNLTGIRSNTNRGDNYANASGAVCVFTLSNSIWTQQTHIKASNTETADLFGLTVSLSADGKTLAVGAVDEDSGTQGIGGNQGDNSVMNSGAVYLY